MKFGSTRGKVRKMSTKTTSEDIISTKLPESVISHILSFLPTKEAVRTSVLSKRWINRWTSITTLDLNDSELCIYPPICSGCKTNCISTCYEYVECDITLCRWCFLLPKHIRFHMAKQVDIDEETGRKIPQGEKLQLFVNFVGRALLLTNKISSSLERFSFVICNKLDLFLLNTWISGILNQRLKSLQIHSSNFTLPFSALTSYYLFNSTSLEELELLLYSFSSVRVPVSTISFHFGHLKLLNLSGIFFKIDPSTDSMTLGLPLLKKFAIKNCIWSKGKDVIVQAPLLETLSIEQDHYFAKLESLSHDPCSQSIKFNALQQHLKEFTYSGCGVSHQIHLSGTKFLSHVSPKLILKGRQEKISKTRRLPIILLLLQQFHQVKCIKFEALDPEVLTQVDIPVFPNLSHLELNLVTVEVLIGWLQKSPLIKTLVLKGIPKFAKEILSSTVVPDSLASSLQVVKFEQVNGEEHELFLANFFMENGMMLEKVGFSLARDKSKVMEEFKEKMYSLKKGFSFAVVEL